MKMRISLPVCIGVVAVACLLALFVPFPRQLCAEPIRVGVAMDIKTALIRIADGQGFFKKQGLDVVLKEYESGALAVPDLVADKLDWATAAEFVFVVQNARHPRPETGSHHRRGRRH